MLFNYFNRRWPLIFKLFNTHINMHSIIVGFNSRSHYKRFPGGNNITKGGVHHIAYGLESKLLHLTSLKMFLARGTKFQEHHTLWWSFHSENQYPLLMKLKLNCRFSIIQFSLNTTYRTTHNTFLFKMVLLPFCHLELTHSICWPNAWWFQPWTDPSCLCWPSPR